MATVISDKLRASIIGSFGQLFGTTQEEICIAVCDQVTGYPRWDTIKAGIRLLEREGTLVSEVIAQRNNPNHHSRKLYRLKEGAVATRKPSALGISANRRLVAEIWEYRIPDHHGTARALQSITADLAHTHATLLAMWETDGLYMVAVERA